MTPFDTQQRRMRAGTPPEDSGLPYPGFLEGTFEEQGLRIERGVKVPLRDGVEIYADLYRPESQLTDLPVLIPWSPYGKHSPISWSWFEQPGVTDDDVSSYTPIEGPDPMWWCPKGYAVLVPDIRGAWDSPGEAEFFNGQEAHDGHDVVEWAGTQSWSNGKVGLCGVSYLAWAQWYIAATRPPHLAAINPWEGVSDFYRELYFHGGIPDTQFTVGLFGAMSVSRTRVEDMVAMAREHQLYDEYWRSKNADLAAIDVPAFVVASWSDHGLHTRGTLEGFKRISSEHKWLEIHGRKKWQYYYDSESLARQLAFFNTFLKGENTTELDRWPKVRIEVRERFEEGEFRAEQEWPLARANLRKAYLDTSDGSLRWDPPAEASSVEYEATVVDDRATFDMRFDSDQEIIGGMRLRLWIEVDEADDADLFVAVQKLDPAGDVVHFPYYSHLVDGEVALGWLRASHRELDEAASRPEQPVLLHQREQRLSPNEPVAVDIEILPSGTSFRAGETLRLIIQGTDVKRYESPFTIRHQDSRNVGRHRIHAGGPYDSHLVLPVIETT